MAAAWDDLLQGEELAYLTTDRRREPRTAPLPDTCTRSFAPLSRGRASSSSTRTSADVGSSPRGRACHGHDRTASGKTLAFNLPVLDALATQPKNRALYLYPTKALAQDRRGR